MRKYGILIAAVFAIFLCQSAQEAQAQWWGRGGYGAGFYPGHPLTRGGYGPAAFRPSPDALYNGFKNNGYYDRTTGRSRGYGATEPGMVYFPPQVVVVPPPPAWRPAQQFVPPQPLPPPPEAPMYAPDPRMQSLQREETPPPPKMYVARLRRQK